MATDDTEPSGRCADRWGRCAAILDCSGRTLPYDRENDDTWLRSDVVVDLAGRR